MSAELADETETRRSPALSGANVASALATWAAIGTARAFHSSARLRAAQKLARTDVERAKSTRTSAREELADADREGSGR